MISSLLSELEDRLSIDVYNDAKEFLDHSEYGLALEDVAYEVVRLKEPLES